MKQLLDEIDIPAEGIYQTLQEANTLAQSLQTETMTQAFTRLFLLDMRFYVQSAIGGVLLIFIGAYLFPSIRITSIFLYFLILAILSAYELYKQHIYDTEELLSVATLNSGRCFLYKCVLCSLTQLLCFIFILIFTVCIFHESINQVILNSILPLYIIQCIAIAFEKWMRSISHVMILYTLSYGIYFYIVQEITLHIPSYLAISYILPIFIGACILLSTLFFILYKKTETGGLQLWNLH